MPLRAHNIISLIISNKVMTTYSITPTDEESFIRKKRTLLDIKHDKVLKNVLKPKEKNYKYSCYEQKLKKYNLSRKKKHDPDVLKISDNFTKSLSLYSSSDEENLDENNILFIETNYLTKMARSRKVTESVSNVVKSNKNKIIKVKENESKGTKRINKNVNLPQGETEKVNAFHLMMTSRAKINTEPLNKSLDLSNYDFIDKTMNVNQVEIFDKYMKETKTLKRNLSMKRKKSQEQINNQVVTVIDSDSNSVKLEDTEVPRKKLKLKKIINKLISPKSVTPKNLNNKSSLLNFIEKNDLNINMEGDQQSGVIKVKLKPGRRKKKSKAVKNNDSYSEPTHDDIKHVKPIETTPELKENGRPKRTIKKPVKYISDDEFSISDDSCDKIFSPVKTPIKLKKITPLKILNINSPKELKVVKMSAVNVDELECTERECKEGSHVKKPIKLAPIFAQKQKRNKVLSETKQKFLYSGLPKKLELQKKQEPIKLSDYFSMVTHVQQKYKHSPLWCLSNINVKFLPEHNIEIKCNLACDNNFLISRPIKKRIIKNPLMGVNLKVDVKSYLHNIKSDFPQFPVYKAYRILKEKFLHPDKFCNESQQSDLSSQFDDNQNTLPWTEKYKPQSSDEVFGNIESIKFLKKWLEDWKDKNLELSKSQGRSRSDSTDSANYFYNSDSDSRDAFRMLNNVLIVTGPQGSGKTSSVYAVANELSIKVLEINASSKRTGKKIVTELQEATQSHKVNRPTNNDHSQSLDGWKKTTRKLAKQFSEDYFDSDSQPEKNCTGMSLILVEDADLVFDQDEGFVSGLLQIVHSSKRPVILVTSCLKCLHLQKFINYNNVVRFKSFKPKILGSWLDILCLVEFGHTWPRVGEFLLKYHNGDMRKAINSLQLWVKSANNVYSSSPVSNTSPDLLDIEDENSKLDEFVMNENNNCDYSKSCIIIQSISQTFIDYAHSTTCIPNPINLSSVSWNITEKYINKMSLNDTLQAFDCLSVVDSFNLKMRKMDISLPWSCHPKDSVLETQDHTTYEQSHNLHDEILSEIVNLSLKDIISSETYDISKTNIRVSDKFTSSNNSLIEAVVVNNQLDRRGLILDYLPSIRDICRSERTRSCVNSKRNNRFLHYMNSMKLSCKQDTFERACEMLCSPSSVE